MMKNEAWVPATTWMNLETMVLSERSQTQRPHVVRFHLYEIQKTDKTIETESGLVVTRVWGREEWGRPT